MSLNIPRQKVLLKLLEGLKLFYTDLNLLIVGYDRIQWEGKHIQDIRTYENPGKMVTDQKYFYICMPFRCIARYTVETLQLVDKFTTISEPEAIDISGNELYVYNYDGPIQVFETRTKEVIRQWNPPGVSCAIKLNRGNLYYANCHDHQIHVYNLSGVLLKQFGKQGSEDGQFDGPSGMDIDDDYIFIVDSGNSRVQVFHLSSCTYSHKWGSSGTGNGEFVRPFEIRLDQDLCYVGDQNGVQVFTKDGQEFVYRFGENTPGSGTGEFLLVRGISVLGNRLYVGDYGNQRLVVLQ